MHVSAPASTDYGVTGLMGHLSSMKGKVLCIHVPIVLRTTFQETLLPR